MLLFLSQAQILSPGHLMPLDISQEVFPSGGGEGNPARGGQVRAQGWAAEPSSWDGGTLLWWKSVCPRSPFLKKPAELVLGPGRKGRKQAAST